MTVLAPAPRVLVAIMLVAACRSAPPARPIELAPSDTEIAVFIHPRGLAAVEAAMQRLREAGRGRPGLASVVEQVDGWVARQLGGPFPSNLAEAGLSVDGELVGHSSGAIHARYFAHTRAAAVAGLVLVDPFCEGMDARWQSEGVSVPDPPRWFTTLQVAVTRLGIARLMQRLAPAPASDDPLGPAVSHTWLRPAFWRTTAWEAAAGASCDDELIRVRERSSLPMHLLTARESLARESAPSEAFHARYNRVWLDEHTKLLAWFDDASHTIVDDVDHMMQLGNPAIVADAITDVARRTARADS